VVDDGVAKDPFMAKVLKIAAPSTVKVEVYTTEEAAEVLKGEDTGEKVIVLAKYPATILELVKLGVGIKELNVGGMGASKGRKSFYKNISVSQEEKDIFKELIDKGVDISIQIVPDAKKIDVAKLI
jgi:PTS system mannose-specific IIB component